MFEDRTVDEAPVAFDNEWTFEDNDNGLVLLLLLDDRVFETLSDKSWVDSISRHSVDGSCNNCFWYRCC